MATLTLPKPDDNEYLKDIGMNFDYKRNSFNSTYIRCIENKGL